MDVAQIAFLVAMGAIVLANYVYMRDALYPAFIQALVWFGVMVLYVFYQDVVYPLSPAFYAIVLAGTLLFSLGCYAACRGFEPVKEPIRDLEFEPKEWYMRLLIWLPVLGLIPFLLKVQALSQEGPLEPFFQNLRAMINEAEDRSGGGAFGWLAYLYPISFVSVALQVLLERHKTHRALFYLSFGTAVVYAVLSTGRAFVLFLILFVAGVLLITRRISPARTFVVGTAAGVVTFFGIGLLVGKGGMIGDQIEVESLQDMLLAYSLGPLPAFDEYLHMNIDGTNGRHVFRSFYAVLSSLGFDVEVRALVQPFVLVPFPTNVYTVYQPYYADFGIAGLVATPFLFGYAHGFVYRRAVAGHLPAVLAYALMLFPLVFQFYQDNYFSLLSMWTQYAVLIGLFFYRLKWFAPARQVAYPTR